MKYQNNNVRNTLYNNTDPVANFLKILFFRIKDAIRSANTKLYIFTVSTASLHHSKERRHRCWERSTDALVQTCGQELDISKTQVNKMKGVGTKAPAHTHTHTNAVVCSRALKQSALQCVSQVNYRTDGYQ